MFIIERKVGVEVKTLLLKVSVVRKTIFDLFPYTILPLQNFLIQKIEHFFIHLSTGGFTEKIQGVGNVVYNSDDIALRDEDKIVDQKHIKMYEYFILKI